MDLLLRNLHVNVMSKKSKNVDVLFMAAEVWILQLVSSNLVFSDIDVQKYLKKLCNLLKFCLDMQTFERNSIY